MSENENSNNSSGGFGLCGATFIVFLVLKLCGVIDWSWWWVTAPLWIPLGLVVVVLLGAFLVIGIIAIIAHRQDKKRRKRAKRFMFQD